MSAGMTKRDSHVGIEQAWHGLTKVVPRVEKSNCGIVYAMEKRRYELLDANGQIITKQVPILDKKKKETGRFETVSASDQYAIVSLDDGLPIGNAVGVGYQLISNEQIMDMIEASLSGTSHKIVSVGTVADRSKLFVSIQLSANIIAGNRETQNVLNVLAGHGGVFGLCAQSGFTVVVCSNTFAMALREGKKSEFKLRMKHTGNAKIENMGKAIDMHYGVTAEFQQAMDTLAGQTVTPVESKRIFAGYLIDDETVNKGEIPTRTSNTVDTLQDLFLKGLGNDGNDACDVFNAFTDYYSHSSSGGDDKWRQFESSEFGAGARAKTEAFDLLMGKSVKGIGDLSEVMKRGERALQLV